MRRILITIRNVSLAISLVAGVTGCAGDFSRSVLVGGSSITAPVDNPVTSQRLSQIEESLRLAMTGLVGYRRLCIAKAIAQSCQDTILKIQPYTKLAATEVKHLRVFVRQNDQINAVKVFTSLKDLIANINAARGAT